MSIVKSSTARRRLKVEPLEQRIVFAGNVDVMMAGMTYLSIQGDTDDNVISVEEIAPNVVKVTGYAGTTINGGTTPVITSAPLIDMVFARMNDGDDIIKVANLTLDDNQNGQLYIEGGAGEDRVKVYNVQARRSITVDTGENDDTVQSYLTATRYHEISLGNGEDDMSIEQFTAGYLKLTSLEGDDYMFARNGMVCVDIVVASGSENDTILLRDLQVNRDLNVETYFGDDRVKAKNLEIGRSMVVMTDAGNDLVTVRQSQIGSSLKMDTGLGNDRVRLRDLDAGSVGMNTGAGDDGVHLLNVAATSLLHVFQGDGEDRLFVKYCSSASPEFDGGGGQDMFYIKPNFFASPSVFYASSYEILM